MSMVDQEARDKASQVQHELNNHKQVMEIELRTLKALVVELKSQLKWAGGLIVMLFISTLTWSLAQQYSANEAQKKDMAQQIELLKEQERARNATRSEILGRLPAGGTEATGAAGGVGEAGDLGGDSARNGAKN